MLIFLNRATQHGFRKVFKDGGFPIFMEIDKKEMLKIVKGKRMKSEPVAEFIRARLKGETDKRSMLGPINRILKDHLANQIDSNPQRNLSLKEVGVVEERTIFYCDGVNFVNVFAPYGGKYYTKVYTPLENWEELDVVRDVKKFYKKDL